MAGYVGTKAVLLSTTAANVGGDADIGGALTVGGAFTSQGIDDNATSTAMTLDGSGNVGIGTSSPTFTSGYGGVHIANDYAEIHLTNSSSGSTASDGFKVQQNSANNAYLWNYENAFIAFGTNNSERMRLDASGNLLVGKTSADSGSSDGLELTSNGRIYTSANGLSSLILNRRTTDGNLVQFKKDGTTTVGSIGVTNTIGVRNTYIAGTLTGLSFANVAIFPTNQSGAVADNSKDLGYGMGRFDDIYATNPNINTSDRNEKQDIAELTDAEQRVAVACKGLLRKFRWKDAVAKKGDDARIHCGIIAQDLQAAFAAEGLDAGDYAMFISTTWWEHDVEVPAVEAVAEVLDEEGNVVTEAVEAVDAYTRTDTYDTQEEAPEGATERTRLGVRYSELLAFIIGAL
jgi:hypothetical protein